MLDIIVPKESATQIWQQLSHESEKHDIPRIGRAAYDAFRISRGIPAFGAEISNAFNPYEAGLAHAISFTKGCYIGQEVIARLDTYEKVQRELVGLMFEELQNEVQTGARVAYESSTAKAINNWSLLLA